jgi:hypothetical protein
VCTIARIAAANMKAPLAMLIPPVFARPLMDLPEPELVHPADFGRREALIRPRFVDYPIR